MEIEILESPEVDPDDLAARAMLLALMCSRGGSTASTFRFGEALLTLDSAIEKLAEHPKPLECDAELVGDILQVLCSEVSERLAWFGTVRQNQARDPERVGPVLRHAVQEADDPCIRLIAGAAETRLSLNAVERWYLDYVPSVRYGTTGRAASPTEHEEGICWVVEIS